MTLQPTCYVQSLMAECGHQIETTKEPDVDEIGSGRCPSCTLLIKC